MTTLVTGATGFLGGYVATRLLEAHRESLAVLVRAKDMADAERRLWHAWQLHLPFARFEEHLRARVAIHLGDITQPSFGLTAAGFDALAEQTRSVVHVAAALNRRSERVCMDVNLRGTLEVLQLVRAAHTRRPLRRFSHVSTTAVAGERNSELVREDDAIDFGRRDYDPYARTKKFSEHMIERLLPDVPVTIFRPSTVIGDSRFGATTQFDMLRAVLTLARMRVLPIRAQARHDIVPANYVGHAIADIHVRDQPKHRIYHLSAGLASESHEALMERLRLHGRPIRHAFVPALERPFGTLMDVVANTPRAWGVSGAGGLMQAFWPYVIFDTVFDNARVVNEIGVAPVPFGQYGSAVLDFALDHGFEYPFAPWPSGPAARGQEAPWPG